MTTLDNIIVVKVLNSVAQDYVLEGTCSHRDYKGKLLTVDSVMSYCRAEFVVRTMLTDMQQELNGTAPTKLTYIADPIVEERRDKHKFISIISFYGCTNNMDNSLLL
jgi:hypothetical protein